MAVESHGVTVVQLSDGQTVQVPGVIQAPQTSVIQSPQVQTVQVRAHTRLGDNLNSKQNFFFFVQKLRTG